MVELHCLEPGELERFLQRRRATPALTLEMSLAENLLEVLRKANEFVPSAAGSILLDDPAEKRGDRRGHTLTFIAAFGEKASGLVGKRIPADKGIAGHVYISGRSHSSSDVRADGLFYAQVDAQTTYRTESLVAIPIRIEQEVCGVLELINRRGADAYPDQDVNLLEIFADYISISIQNVLDGRQAQEIARRDNLTGLFNDRYLHIALSRAITRAERQDRDLGVAFLDLDFFKRVNDTHGHLAGSQVLREVGNLIRDLLPPGEALAARYGGDEFVIVVPDLDLPGMIDLAEAIRTGIVTSTFCTRPGEIQPDPLYLTGITCSIGVATLKRHLGEADAPEQWKSTLLRLADAAMYVAKETGRNRTAVAGEPVRRRPAAERPA